MSHLTLAVDTMATADVAGAAAELLELSARLKVNVTTTWNGHQVTARPGMTVADLHRDYDLTVKLSNYPNS